MKKKKTAQARKKQKQKTALLRDMYKVALGMEEDAKLSMRGKHWRFERPQLRQLVLKTYEENVPDFYNGLDRFVEEALFKRVKANFKNKIVPIADYPIHGEKSIRKEIKELIKLGKIKSLRKSEDYK